MACEQIYEGQGFIEIGEGNITFNLGMLSGLLLSTSLTTARAFSFFFAAASEISTDFVAATAAGVVCLGSFGLPSSEK